MEENNKPLGQKTTDQNSVPADSGAYPFGPSGGEGSPTTSPMSTTSGVGAGVSADTGVSFDATSRSVSSTSEINTDTAVAPDMLSATGVNSYKESDAGEGRGGNQGEVQGGVSSGAAMGLGAAQSGAPQGIFSSGELAVNSENLDAIKPELSEENKSRIASAFGKTDATRKHEQLSEQMAEQDAISGTVLPAGSFGGGAGRASSNTTASTATGDIRLPGRKKKSKLPLLALAVVVVLAVVAGVWWMGRNNNSQNEVGPNAIGVVNTDIIFDQTAPIPAIFGNSYGYISPNDGAQIIGPRFLSAERFYGEYAVAKTGTNGIVSNTLVINRAGEIIFDFDGDAAATYYDIENNLWMIDGDAYNIDLQKLSPANTKGQYIGNGYLLVTSEGENGTVAEAQDNTSKNDVADDGNNDNNDDNDGESSSSSSSDNEQNPSSTVSGSIYNLDNKKVYDCEAYCSAFTLKADNKIYGVVRIWGDSSRVINLSSGEVIYQTTQGMISLQEDVLVERSGNNETFLKIQNNQVVKTVQPEATVTVSNSNEYVIETCSDASKYTIKSIDGRIVSNCDIDNYHELPANLYLAYRNKFKKSPILVVKNDELQLLDMNDAQVIKTYSGQNAMLFEDSPFLYMQNLLNNESRICNILSESNDACQSLGNESQSVEGYSNYFTISGGASEHIYNAKMKEIR